MTSPQHLIQLVSVRVAMEANIRRCRSHVYTRVQTHHLQLDAVSCLCLPNIISKSICLSNLSLMATSEHGDKAEIAASVHHSPGQPSLEPAIQDTTVEASLSTVLDPSDGTTCERETLSTNQISGAFVHYFALMWNLMPFPVNIAMPKKQESMIPNPELSIKTLRATIEDGHRLQGAISISQSKGPLGNMYPMPQCPGIPCPESVLGVVKRPGSISGAPVEITALSISVSNSNIPTHKYTASAISSGESNSILDTATHIDASEPSVKGRVQFYLLLQVHHTKV